MRDLATLERARLPEPAGSPRGGRPEGELVADARRGDQGAFAELVTRNKDLVYSLAFALTGNSHQSEEIVQETFVVVWKRLGEMQAPDRFRGWLCGITRLVSRHVRSDDLRRLRFQPLPIREGADVPSPEPSPLERAITREDERFLWLALGKVPEIYRLPLVLFYSKHQSVEAVAEALDLSPVTVKKRLSRGRRLLQHKFTLFVASTLPKLKLPRGFEAGIIAAIVLGGSRASAKTPAIETMRPWARRSAAGKALIVGAVSVVLATAFSMPGAGRARTAALRAPRSPEKPGEPRAMSAVGPRSFIPPAKVGGSAVRLPEAVPLLAFDFEDGAVPSQLGLGYVVAAPPGSVSRFCATGSIKIAYPETYLVEISGASGVLFPYSPTAVVSFDYWVGDDFRWKDGKGITAFAVWLMDTDWGRNYHHYLRDYTPEKWNHAEIPFSDFLLPKDAEYPPGPQDQIRTLGFGGGHTGGKPIFVDNIKVFFK